MERSAVDRVVYLHGFRSSPASAKGRELAAAAAEWNADFSAPDLNLSPREADALVGSLLSPLSAQARRCTLLVGSSLGGFYALRAARAYGCPTAVVNPCLMPWDFVPAASGTPNYFWHQSNDYGEAWVCRRISRTCCRNAGSTAGSRRCVGAAFNGRRDA